MGDLWAQPRAALPRETGKAPPAAWRARFSHCLESDSNLVSAERRAQEREGPGVPLLLAAGRQGERPAAPAAGSSVLFGDRLRARRGADGRGTPLSPRPPARASPQEPQARPASRMRTAPRRRGSRGEGRTQGRGRPPEPRGHRRRMRRGAQSRPGLAAGGARKGSDPRRREAAEAEPGRHHSRRRHRRRRVRAPELLRCRSWSCPPVRCFWTVLQSP